MSSSRRAALAATILLATPHLSLAQNRRFRLGHNNTITSVVHAGALGFDAALKTASAGRLGLEIMPNSTLGSEQQTADAVAAGTLDMAIAPIGTLGAMVKEVGLVEMPFLFRDVAHARGALAGALGAHCAALLVPRNIIIGAWSEIGLRQITANKPVRAAADLRGLKIRVPISEVIRESFRVMGAAADELPFPQLPDALRTGRFDAQENPISVIVANGLAAHQSHLSMTNHVYTPGGIIISGDVMEELSAADREMMIAAARAGGAAASAFTDRTDAEGLAQLRAAGMTIVTDIDHESLRAAAAPARERLAASYGAEAVRRIVSLAG